jgi:hypothetical protein
MRQLLVFGEKTFKLEIPDDAKITFGPWSPPMRNEHGFERSFNPTGTLRIYQGSKENIVALFAGVTGFRDLSLSYAEEVAKEEGATIWRDDEQGYFRESKVQRTKTWTPGDDGPPVIEAAPKPKRRTRKKAE